MASKPKIPSQARQRQNRRHAPPRRQTQESADRRVPVPHAEADKSPIQVAYERRNTDLDPQLVWRGKDEQDWSDLVVHAPPLYIQEKVHPKVLIDDLLRQTKAARRRNRGAD
jgi:adenine-specific DNA-methyltransferase